MSYLTEYQTRTTAQTESMRDDQVENSAGGFAWAVGPFERLQRWLVLGSEGGSYYAGERKLTTENVAALDEALNRDGLQAVELIAEVSHSGRAPRNDEALFALARASAHSDETVRAAALAALPRVARIGTHLFTFLTFVQQFRGWGPALKKAVGAWYLDKEPEQLAYQLVKYRQRGGWTHRDVLRLAKPRPERASAHDELLAFAVGKETDPSVLPSIIGAYETVNSDVSLDAKLAAIRMTRLPREALPSALLKDPDVWEALLGDMPMTAMIRNLANMTRIGLIAPFSDAARLVVDRLRDTERLRKARIHPIAVLSALRTYASGFGFRSQGEGWTPVPQVVDALDAAFYQTFDFVEPTGKRWLLALDVSGSMNTAVLGVPGLSARDASSAMAMVTANTERDYYTVAFQHGIEPIALSPKQRLDDVTRIPWKGGGTDCSLPMLYALQNRVPVDVFTVYTDSETWGGAIHPAQALIKYREQMGIDARLIVVGMVSNGFSIADPNDRGMLDIVGFDTATPQVMADFALGAV